jgi:DNA polymerase alpha subunit A
MYGCLGFSNSRFFAKPIAALVTSKGRDVLLRTVDIATTKVGLEVIYGDTDSIMINTRLNDEKELLRVKELGEQVKREVNKLYKTLELEIDGIFRKMLLLQKKKYAAKTVIELPNGEVEYGQEIKGLDLVRRDWCIQSKDTGRYVTEQILSDQDNEAVARAIEDHLEELAAKMRSKQLPLEKFVITKGLSKHPDDYPDAKAQPHVLVAKQMIKNNRHVNVGDHIPYVITEAISSVNADQPLAKALTVSERAYHPDEIERSNGALVPDIEWYLHQQILPPISRLCEQIEGMTQQVLAEKLGMDVSKFRDSNNRNNAMDIGVDILSDYIPKSKLPDTERFENVDKLRIYCLSCNEINDFPGIGVSKHDIDVHGKPTITSGLRCTNPDCDQPKLWGRPNHFELYSYIVNAVSLGAKRLMTKYYQGTIQCDEPSCSLVTQQLSVVGNKCLRAGCHGVMLPTVTEEVVNTHLIYLERLFSQHHAFSVERDNTLGKNERETLKMLHTDAKRYLQSNAFNWLSPAFWKGLFPTLSAEPLVQ